MRLSDQVAIITGGANGIGRATTLALAREGAAVVIADIDTARSENLAAELRAQGHQCLPVYCDLTNPTSVRAMVEATVATFGRVDILVNCAGGSGMSPFYKTDEGKRLKWVEELPESEWDATLALNLTAPFLCAKYVAPIMKRQGGGKIVNFSSIAAEIGRRDSTYAYAAYAAAKAGVTGLTRHLANELGPFGITVNCVAPGSVLSERMAERYGSDPSWADPDGSITARTTPLGRKGLPEEIASTVVFLVSAEASFVTGVTLDVNGGRYMR